MSDEQNIKKDYFWNSLGVLLQNAVSPILLLVVARINGVGDVGLFSFAFSLAFVFYALGMWGGRTYQVSDTKQLFNSQSYIAVRIVTATVMMVGALLFAFANSYDQTKITLILLLVGMKALESIADALYGVMQSKKHLYLSGYSLATKAVLGLTAFFVIDLVTKSIILSSIGLVMVQFLGLILFDYRYAVRLDKISAYTHSRYHYNQAIKIIRLSALISATTFMMMLSVNIPRYFVDIYHTSQIGYFGIITMPITLIALMMSFILQPKILGLSNMFAEGRFDELRVSIRKIILVTLGVGVLILIAAFFIGVPALNLVFGFNFSPYKEALLLFILGAIANALVAVYMNILIIMRKLKGPFYIFLITNIFLTIGSFLLVRQFGTLGGAIIFTATNVIQVIALYVYAKFYNYPKREER